MYRVGQQVIANYFPTAEEFLTKMNFFGQAISATFQN